MLQILQQLGNKASTLESQISTGQKSTSFSGVAPQAAKLVDLAATQSQQQGYIDTITTVNTRVQTMSLAMQNIATVASTLQTQLSNNAFSSTGAGIQSTAQQLLVEVGSYLNTQDGSRFVFSGNKTTTPSYDPTNLPTPGDLTTNISADYYNGDTAVSQATVDSNVTVKYGVTGDNPAFEQIIRVLNFFANNSTPLSQTSATDVANVQKGQQMLAQAVQQVQQLVATSGEQQQSLTQLSAAHKNALTLASTTSNNVLQIDSATAITQLNTLQTQLQASYQTMNILQNLSLVNYLK